MTSDDGERWYRETHAGRRRFPNGTGEAPELIWAIRYSNGWEYTTRKASVDDARMCDLEVVEYVRSAHPSECISQTGAIERCPDVCEAMNWQCELPEGHGGEHARTTEYERVTWKPRPDPQLVGAVSLDDPASLGTLARVIENRHGTLHGIGTTLREALAELKRSRGTR